MKKQSRREFLKALGAAAASAPVFSVLPGFAKVGGAPGAGKKQPNVVLVITDDQGYGDLGCHGNPVLKTPNLDSLYGQSVRLNNFHVSPTCSPTRAALMTGRYCNRTGVWHTVMGRSLLRKDEVTMADVFTAGGYKTGIFGKWHLGDNYPFRPQDRGFDQVLIHGGGGIGNTQDYWGNDYFDDTYFRNGKPEKFTGYCTDVWFREAMKFIEANKDRPFFCYLPTNAPHGPLRVPEKYSAPYWGKGVKALLCGMIANIDENMGLLMSRLKELGIEDNTILIFMTDNGTAGGRFNAGMRGSKGSEYDGGHRVPCFIRWPGAGIEGGLDINRITAHIDMLPTLIELCSLKEPDGVKLDGDSLVPLLKGNDKNSPDRTLITDSQRVEYPIKWRKSAVMTDRWRLVNGEELYDMKADPGQRDNVKDKYPEVFAKLRNDYESWWADVSERFLEYCGIIIGSDKENPAKLTSHDWHDHGPWNQDQVRQGEKRNGFWAVEVARDGEYEIALRRWPLEVDAPITAAIADGQAISASTARLRIADFDRTRPIPRDAAAVTFKLKLKAGNTRLQTWFIDDNGESRGAYYVYAKRLD
ncbi:MAG TPA: arylsulfatase [Sedimentisphaerales bacterium]|nr:arylsulfatase [Sedimentisphaerales bacterium]